MNKIKFSSLLTFLLLLNFANNSFGMRDSKSSEVLSASKKRIYPIFAARFIDGKTRLYDVETGRCFRTLPGTGVKGKEANSVVFDNFGDLVARKNADGEEIEICDLQTGQVLKTLRADTGKFFDSLLFSPTEKLLASVEIAYSLPPGVTVKIKLWDIQTESCVYTLCNVDHEIVLPKLAFSSNGKLLFSTLFAGGLCKWDVQTGKAASGRKRLGLLPKNCAFVKMAFNKSRDLICCSNTLAYREKKQFIQIYSSADKDALSRHCFKVRIERIVIGRNGDFIAFVLSSGECRVLDINADVFCPFSFTDVVSAGFMYDRGIVNQLHSYSEDEQERAQFLCEQDLPGEVDVSVGDRAESLKAFRSFISS